MFSFEIYGRMGKLEIAGLSPVMGSPDTTTLNQAALRVVETVYRESGE